MSIIRTERKTDYTVIPNEVINDKDLSGDTLGLLVFLLSKPVDWWVNVKALEHQKRFGSHGKIVKSLQTLRTLGYARLIRMSTGHTEWIITDTKATEEQDDSHIPKSGIRVDPHSEKPHSEKPHSENRNVLQSKDLYKTLNDTKSATYAREAEIQDAPIQPDAAATRRGQLATFLRHRGVTITPIHPDLCQWVNSDITDEEAQEAVDRARQREGKKGNEPIPAKYLSPIVADVISERAERLKKCPDVASTTPGSLSSINPNRGPHYASKQQTRSAIFDFACNPFAGHGESRKSVYGAIDGVSHQVEQCRVLN